MLRQMSGVVRKKVVKNEDIKWKPVGNPNSIKNNQGILVEMVLACAQKPELPFMQHVEKLVAIGTRRSGTLAEANMTLNRVE